MSTGAMRPCAFFHCPNGADPRWGGYCDGHGALTVDELTCRTADENAELRAEVERLREALEKITQERDKALRAAGERGAGLADMNGRGRSLVEAIQGELHSLQHLRQAHKDWDAACDRQRARAEKAEAEVERLRETLGGPSPVARAEAVRRAVEDAWLAGNARDHGDTLMDADRAMRRSVAAIMARLEVE